jgi:hypothetical protein
VNIRLERVQYIPPVLEPGVLYFAEEFGAATHLCACGCGHKVQTPVGPGDYTLRIGTRGPTLSPSIGNWQRPCQSHYWIWNGEVVWSRKWTPKEIAAGRAGERARNQAFFERRARAGNGMWCHFLAWLKRLLGLAK